MNNVVPNHLLKKHQKNILNEKKYNSETLQNLKSSIKKLLIDKNGVSSCKVDKKSRKYQQFFELIDKR